MLDGVVFILVTPACEIISLNSNAFDAVYHLVGNREDFSPVGLQASFLATSFNIYGVEHFMEMK